MLALFLSITTITAGVAAGILFFLFPVHPPAQVKASATIAKTYDLINTVPVESISPTQEEISPADNLTPTDNPSSSNVKAKTATPFLSPSPAIVSPTDSPTPTPSPQTTPSISLTVSPAAAITISANSNPSTTPTPSQTISSSSGLNADIIFNLVNTFRNSNNLPSFEKNDQVCSVAGQRAPQVFNEIFVTGTTDSGLKAMNLPYWVTESIINDDTEKDAVDWWINDPAHRQVMLGNYKYSCAACSGYNCAEIFTSLIAK